MVHPSHACALEEFRSINPLVTGSTYDRASPGRPGISPRSPTAGWTWLSSRSPRRDPQLVSLRALMREPMVFVCESCTLIDGRSATFHSPTWPATISSSFLTGWGIRQRLDKGFADAGVQPVSAYEVAHDAITAELIRHRLAAESSRRSASPRTAFRICAQSRCVPAMTWTLSIASATSQTETRGQRARRHVGRPRRPVSVIRRRARVHEALPGRDCRTWRGVPRRLRGW